MGAAAQVCVWFPAFALSAKLELGAWRRAWLWKDVTWGPEAVPETERAEPPTSSAGLASGLPPSLAGGLCVVSCVTCSLAWRCRLRPATVRMRLRRQSVAGEPVASGPVQFRCDCMWCIFAWQGDSPWRARVDKEVIGRCVRIPLRAAARGRA